MTTFIGIVIGMFGISVMQLILATAMPYVAAELGGESLYSWVFSGYMLASLLTIPIFSKLADLYGKKRYYLIGMGVFAVGTLIGGFALSMNQLIAARVIQGLGAGIMIPISMALISDQFPAEKRGVMIGLFSMVQLLAILFSPLLGSYLTKEVGWNWIFFITFGMILVAFLLIALGKQPSTQKSTTRWSEIDIIGGLLFGLFCALVVTFSDMVSGQGLAGLSSILLLAGAVVSCIFLLWNERRHKDPVIKVSFFKTKVLRRSIISSLIAGGIMYGLVTLLPLCSVLLNQQGYDLNESRILLMFMLGITFGLMITSRLVTKLKPSFPKIVWVLSLITSGLMYYSISIANFVLFSIATVILGLCLGAIMATLLVKSQNAVNSEDRTVLSGLVQLGRYLGAAVGVTILTGMLPEASQFASIAQLLGAFALLVGMYLAGLVNELL